MRSQAATTTTKAHMLQLRWKIPHASIKTQSSQIKLFYFNGDTSTNLIELLGGLKIKSIDSMHVGYLALLAYKEHYVKKSFPSSFPDHHETSSRF